MGIVHMGSAHMGNVHMGNVHLGSVHLGSVHMGNVHMGSVHMGSVHIGSVHMYTSFHQYFITRPPAPPPPTYTSLPHHLHLIPLILHYSTTSTSSNQYLIIPPPTPPPPTNTSLPHHQLLPLPPVLRIQQIATVFHWDWLLYRNICYFLTSFLIRVNCIWYVDFISY